VVEAFTQTTWVEQEPHDAAPTEARPIPMIAQAASRLQSLTPDSSFSASGPTT
jgi:hypothetical protein